MRRIALALSVLTLAFTGTAGAADLPAKAPAMVPVVAPATIWSGFYIGLNGGFGWGNSRHTDTVTGISTGNFDTSGGLFGGTVGFNWQSGQFVFGLEGDLDWANLSGSSNTNCPAGCSTKLTWLATIRPRVGLAWDRFMLYVTGGLSWANINAGQPGFMTNNSRAGWVVGVGGEAMMAPNWSVKAEWLYTGFNDSTYTVAVPVTVRATNFNIFRVGINYHFGRL